MKRYRGKNANHQRLGDAFVPAKKWGKREKEWQKTHPPEISAGSVLKAPSYDEVVALMGALVGPAEHKPMVTADGRQVHQYIWTPGDTSRYLIKIEPEIRIAEPPKEPVSLEFTLPDAQYPALPK
jgi:hypothetical protein